MNAALLAALLVIPGASPAPIESVAVLVDSPKSGCSGTLVDVIPGRTFVLTAKHCSTLDDPDTITFSDGSVAGVDRIVLSHTYDLELLRVATKQAHPTAYIAFNTEPQTRLAFYGRSGDLDWVYAQGFIAGVQTTLKYSKVWEQKVIPIGCLGCAEGGSGGGMFSSGKLAGVFVAGREDNSMSFMIPSSSVVKFLRAAAIEESK